MKNKLFLVLLFLASESHFAQYPRYFHSTNLDANNITIPLGNFGNIENYPTSQWLVTGMYDREIVYDYGIQFIGKVNNSVRWAWSQWSSIYSPGPIINGQSAMVANPADSLKYRVYKIKRGDDSTNPDYAQWPSQWGAPVNSDGSPLLKGDQTLWSVYNSFDTTMFRNHGWYYRTFNEEGLIPVKLEIQQTVFARNGNWSDNIDMFSNTVFFEWVIINKGNENIDSSYFAFWVDNDFSNLQYNAPGYSKQEKLGYNWMNKNVANATNPPMAVGFTHLFSPRAPSVSDTAIFLGKKKPGYKNLPIHYFWPVADRTFSGYRFDTAHEDSTFWNLARGNDLSGNPVIDPTTNQRTYSPLDGEPVTQSGWYWDESITNGEAGFTFFFGPLNFAAQDTQWLMVALVPALGVDRFNSISMMKQKAAHLQSLSYDSIAFGKNPFVISEMIVCYNTEPSEFYLFQNFPNPFNPSTKIKFRIPALTPSLSRGERVMLKVFDILGREVATLVNEELSAGEYEVEFTAGSASIFRQAHGGASSASTFRQAQGGAGSAFATAFNSGIYFYQLRVGNFIETKKMVYLK